MPATADVPDNPRRPCPCGSGRRYKACHGAADAADMIVTRPFTGLAAETAILVVFSAGWLAAGGRPGTAGKLALLAIAAVAMGMQSAAVRRLGQMSSTYLTSTLTGIVAGLVTRQRPAGLGRSLGSLAAIVVGAAGSSVVAADVPDWLPLLVLAPLAAVLAYSLRLWHAPAADIS